MSNLDLKRFVLRSEVLKLYRTFLRASRGAPNPQIKDELGKQVRQEFETQKHLDDGYSIKYALSDGRAKLKQLEAMFGMTS